MVTLTKRLKRKHLGRTILVFCRDFSIVIVVDTTPMVNDIVKIKKIISATYNQNSEGEVIDEITKGEILKIVGQSGSTQVSYSDKKGKKRTETIPKFAGILIR